MGEGVAMAGRGETRLTVSRRARAVRRVISLAAISLLAGLSLAGCTAGQDSPASGVAPMWRVYIADALADPSLTDFERQVLSDYQVSDAEYAEARARYKDCMGDQGWIVTDEEWDGYRLEAVPGSGNEDRSPSSAKSECWVAGSTRYIEPIYIGLRDNPQGRSHAQQVRDCYRVHGVPDGDGLSDDQFEAMIFADGYHASTSEGKLCFWDPMGLLGLTIEDAVEMDANADLITMTQGPQ